MALFDDIVNFFHQGFATPPLPRTPPTLDPLIEEMIRQLGNLQIEFVQYQGRLYVRVFSVMADGSRHYAQAPPGQAPPGQAPPPRRPAARSDSKRRLALKTLGYPPSANPTPDEIRARYKELAIKFHPDKPENAKRADRMTRVNVAYQYLREEWR
jgi:hypothetical protein